MKLFRKKGDEVVADAVAPSGAYSGRLSFDPDSEFHFGEDGYPVVTDDGGKSWRYAVEGDTSHNFRHAQRHIEIKSTQTKHLELTAENGKDYADVYISENEPHHNEVQPGDPHLDEVKFHKDVDAPLATSHTDAWKEAK